MKEEDVRMILTVEDYNKYMGVETLHPLVSVVDFSKMPPIDIKRAYYGLYCVFLKNVVCGPLNYGNKYYDYQEGTVVTMGPGQVYGIDHLEPVKPNGWALVFHPDLIHGTELGRTINDYHFFEYNIDEALHLSLRERQQIETCFRTIQEELEKAIDKHTKRMLCSEIGLLLDYCLRFYDRQFITREKPNSDLLTKFEQLLSDYLHGPQLRQKGLPSVAYFASELCLSPNYFGDLIRKEIGMGPKDYMMQRLVEVAKERLLSDDAPLARIAEDLGFEYANHFTRTFKRLTGDTPSDYRAKNKLG